MKSAANVTTISNKKDGAWIGGSRFHVGHPSAGARRGDLRTAKAATVAMKIQSGAPNAIPTLQPNAKDKYEQTKVCFNNHVSSLRLVLMMRIRL